MKDNTQSSTPAQRPIDKKLGEQAERPIDKKPGEQDKRPIDKKPGEQDKRPIDKKTYHHKELRPRLLELAAQLVQDEGIKGFSIRKLAAMAGVSHAAPYRHFSSKEELLAALMLEGHVRLRRTLLSASEACSGAPHQRLLAMGRGYLDFAAENPAYLTLMFSREAMTAVLSLIQEAPSTDQKRAPTLGKEAFHSQDADSFGVLESMVRACQEEGSLDPRLPSGALSFAVWSQVHGLALLRNEGMLGMMAGERGSNETEALDAIFAVLGSWYSSAAAPDSSA